jgi:hypothetical protein
MEWNWVDYPHIKIFVLRRDLGVQIVEENLFSITFDNFFIHIYVKPYFLEKMCVKMNSGMQTAIYFIKKASSHLL